MKRQKAPVAMFAGLVIVGGAVAIWNAPRPVEDPAHQHEQTKSSPGIQGESRPTARKEDLAGLLKGQGSKKRADGVPLEAEGISPTPTIILPSPADYKPQVNDATPASQWYRDEWRLADDKGKTGGQKGKT